MMKDDPNQKNSQAGGIQFTCTMCGACCRNEKLIVTVTPRDLVRLSSGLGLSPDELLRALDFYLPKDDEVVKGMQDIPQINTERGLAYIAIKKMENGDCIFLKDNLCMVHAIRPAVCVSFPFVFHEHGGEKTWGLSAMREICPGLEEGEIVSESELYALSVVVLEDLATFHQFAQEWNRRVNCTALGFVEKALSDTRFTLQ